DAWGHVALARAPAPRRPCRGRGGGALARGRRGVVRDGPRARRRRRRVRARPRRDAAGGAVTAVVVGDGAVARAVAEALRARGVEVGAELREPLEMLFLGRAAPPVHGPLAELEPAAFAGSLEDGLTSRFLVLADALPLLAAARGRAVVEVAAAAAAPAQGQAADAAVGTALVGLARA